MGAVSAKSCSGSDSHRAKGNHLRSPKASSLKILVPISGNDRSQKASEVAIALARSTGSELNAFHIPTDAEGRTSSKTQSVDEGVLRSVVEMADRFSLEIRTTVGVGKFSADAILRQAAKDGSNLIIMGVDRVPDKGLSFGAIASALLLNSKASVLLLSGGGK